MKRINPDGCASEPIVGKAFTRFCAFVMALACRVMELTADCVRNSVPDEMNDHYCIYNDAEFLKEHRDGS
jgi:hypothetical protein